MNPSEVLREVFRLEGRRTLGLARLGRVPGAEGALTTVDAELAQCLERLASHGIAYPAHAIAQRYGFGQADYLVLQLAIAGHHGPAHVQQLTDALEDPSKTVRLSHAIRLLAPGPDSWEHAAAKLRQLPVFTEGCIDLSEDDDPVLSPSQAVRELMGLS